MNALIHPATRRRPSSRPMRTALPVCLGLFTTVAVLGNFCPSRAAEVRVVSAVQTLNTAESRLIVDIALRSIGVPYRENGRNLKTGVDNAGFVAGVYRSAGVRTPEPPVANMAMFGDIVTWQPGASAEMEGQIVELPGAEGMPALRPGDRIYLQKDPKAAAAAREAERLRTGGDMMAQWAAEEKQGGFLTGIYIGAYRPASGAAIQRGVVMASPSAGKVTVVNLDDLSVAARFRFATRGTQRRFVYDPATSTADGGRVVLRSGPLNQIGTVPNLTGSVAVVSVGISRYGGSDSANPGGAAAASTVWSEMNRLFGTRLDRSRSALLITGEDRNRLPTRARVSGALLDAARASRPGDTIVFYFNGMGSGSDIYPAEYVPGDASARSASEAVSLDDLLSQMAAFPAIRFIFFQDYPGASAPRRGMNALRGTGKEAAAFTALDTHRVAVESGSMPPSAQRLVNTLRASITRGDGRMKALTARQVSNEILGAGGFDLYQVPSADNSDVEILVPAMTSLAAGTARP